MPKKSIRTKLTDKIWAQICRIFVEGEIAPDNSRVHPTLAELAERYGVSVSSIRGKSAKENWPDQRAIFQQSISAMLPATRDSVALEKTGKDIAARVAEIDHLVTDVSLIGLRLCRRKLEALSAAFDELEKNGDQGPHVAYKIPANDIAQTGAALMGFHKSARLAAGYITEAVGVENVTGAGVSGLLKAAQEYMEKKNASQ